MLPQVLFLMLMYSGIKLIFENSLRILFLLRIANSYEELRTLHRGVEKTLNPHYHLQQGTAPFDDKEYKRSLFDRI